MPASATLSFDDGMRTSSCCTTLALRMRVSMSAIGSVIVIARSPLSPARLRDAGDLSRVDHLAEADAAQPELAEHRARPAAAAAPRVCAHLELGLALLLLDQGLLCHLFLYCSTAGRRAGTGSRRRRAVPVPRRRSSRWSRS